MIDVEPFRVPGSGAGWVAETHAGPGCDGIQETKLSVLRQCGEAESKRNSLRDHLVSLGQQSMDNARLRVQEARECVGAIYSPSGFHRFVQDFVGEMMG